MQGLRAILTTAAALCALATVACSDTPLGRKQDDLTVSGVKTVTLSVAADTGMRSLLPNTALGKSFVLQVGKNGVSWDRTAIRIDPAAVRSAIGTGTVMRATLELNVALVTPIWQEPGKLAAYPLNRSWTESGATWNCANDRVPENLVLMDCPNADRWTLGSSGSWPRPFVEPPTAEAPIPKHDLEKISLDVTEDVQRALADPARHFGWLLKLSGDPALDWIHFYSRESAKPPRLVVTVKDQCDFDTGQCGPVVKWTDATVGEMPDLEDPISPTDSYRMSNEFNWAATQAVGETTPDGYPTLRYALIYVQSREQFDALDAYEIDWDVMPFFRQERVAKWGNKKGILPLTGDGRGIFVYALIPGKVYNVMRQYALAGQVAFNAVILRAPPAGVGTYADGSVRYDVLANDEYLYRGQGPAPGTAGVGSSQQALGAVFRGIIDGIKDAGKAVVDGIREGIGNLSQVFRGRAGLELTFLAANTDDRFNPDDVLRQGWGKDRGRSLGIVKAEVRVKQGGIGAKLHRGRTDETGYVHLTVAENQPTEICIDLENDAATLTSSFLPRRLCDFSGSTVSQGDMRGTVVRNIVVKKKDVNLFVQLTDGNRFMKTVAKKDLKRARVLVGPIADALSRFARNGGGSGSFTPCLDYPNWMFDTLFASLNGLLVGAAAGAAGGVTLVTGLPGLGELASLGAAFPSMIAPDMVVSKDSRGDRVVPSHEFGHYVMCDQMFKANAVEMGRAYTQVMFQELNGYGEASDEAAAIAEAWADFFASQVAGGVNYMRPNGAHHDSPSSRFCAPIGSVCMDDNIGGPPWDPGLEPFGARGGGGADQWHHQIERIATTMHDVFDGRSDIATADVPSNGGVWLEGTTNPNQKIFGDTVLLQPPFTWTTGHQSDEESALDGAAYGKIIEYWSDESGARLTEYTLFRALTRLMKEGGVSDQAICDLFALHSPTKVCPGWLPISNNLVPGPVRLSGWLFNASPSQPSPAGHSAHWEWTADSPFAEFFEYEVRDTLADRTLESGTEGYARETTIARDISPLPFDTLVEMSVTVVNGEHRSPTVRSTLATRAQDVRGVRVASLKPGRSQICFTESRASAYEIELRSAGVLLGDAGRAHYRDSDGDNEICHTFIGLPATEHHVTIVPLNRHGVPGIATAGPSFIPLALNEVFVSTTRGDDSHPNAGQSATPFRTLDAAAAFVRTERERETAPGERNTTFDAVSIHLALGSYTLSNQWQDSGADFMTEFDGGFRDDGSWIKTTGRSSIDGVATPATSSNCFGFPNSALLVVKSGASLVLRGVHVSVPPGSVASEASPCFSAVVAESADLRIDDSTIDLVGTPAFGSCSLPVSAAAAEGGTSTLIVNRSRITNEVGAATSVSGQFIGVCGTGLSEVSISNSEISAIGSSVAQTVPAQGFLGGVIVPGVGELYVARSRISVAPAAPDWRPSSATQVAVGSIAQRSFIHNSILRTNSGGMSSIPLTLDSVAGGTVELAYNTAVAGSDFAFSAAGPTSLGGGASVLRLVGEPARLSLLNNVFSYAAGTTAGAAAIDRSLLRADPGAAEIRGNVLSVPTRVSGTNMPMRCPGPVPPIGNINDPRQHLCFASSTLPAYTVANNVILTADNCEATSSPATCFATQSGLSSAWTFNAVSFSQTGRPNPTDNGTLSCRGADVSLTAHFPEILRDITDTARPTNVMGLDDDCDGAIDEAGEHREARSVGAFFSPCTCDALHFETVLF